MQTLSVPWLRLMQHHLGGWLDELVPRSCPLCGLLLARRSIGGTCVACVLSLPGARRTRCPRCALPQAAHSTEPCPGCRHLVPEPWFDQTLAVADYAPPLDRALTRLKFGRQITLARPLGELLAARWRGAASLTRLDCLVPIPLSEARLAQRGFNQALELARGMNASLAHRLPIEYRALRRIHDTPAQSTLTSSERQHNVTGVLRCRGRFDGLRVGLIDDVMTTGHTLHEAARMLKQAGAAEVLALVVARTA